jgi:glycosyltransferase involved in cell wall biosynthesis
MVTCNVERFLSEAIESIVGQTFADFEFIIVDFGSSDNSHAIAARYAAIDNRIKLHKISHCNVPEARNAGCLLAQGRYIAVMDADDVSLRNRLELQVNFMERHPEIGLLGGWAEWMDEHANPLWVNKPPTEGDEIKAVLPIRSTFCHPSMLIRTDAFFRVGGYRRIFAQANDYDLALRISEQFPCANLARVILRYRVHVHQISLMKRRGQTLSKLAAQASALARKAGQTDPLNPVSEITGAVVTRLGISKAKQQVHFTSDYLFWMKTLWKAGQIRMALRGTMEILRFDRRHSVRLRLSRINLGGAKFYWQRGRLCAACIGALSATMIDPAMARCLVLALVRRLERRSPFKAMNDGPLAYRFRTKSKDAK